MNLQYIKTNICPVCGCTEVVNERIETNTYGDKRTIWQHVTNGRWEHREFLCGLKIAYVPIFSKEVIINDCQNEPTIIQAKKKLQADKEKLLKFCNENGVSDSLKQKIEYICK